ncbi:MAG TPA: hypothetical protein VFR33_15975 [Candidatus Dormibacteraeota bacterium]|nr:hypothetical protein [Candidatus Dormibacteraeota bacterium]
MSWKAAAGVGAMFVLLCFGTVLVFQAFDRDSHSASDTLRPFIITMAPVWAVAVAAARVTLRRYR